MLTVSGANDNTALNLDASGTATISVGLGTSYGATTISYDTTGVLSLTKVSDETLTLGGTVSYTGLTNIQGGTCLLYTSK